MSAAGSPEAEWWEVAPVGLARVDTTGRVTRINRAGAALLDLAGDALATLDGLFEIDEAPQGAAGIEAERLASWAMAPSEPRELAYRVHGYRHGYIVSFRDVTMRRQQERRAAAVARTAARVASERSLATTLNAMASEVLRANGLAGVQILATGQPDGPLHVMGSAGFSSSDSFFALLMECQRRGADLRMLDALRTGTPVVIHHRYGAVMADPAWEPLHELLRSPRWDAFASVPILVRERAAGILNVFFAPEQKVDHGTIEFLATMADQAALAIDYADLLERERYVARRAERQRLARDLHDSVVQQVFSIGMQTQALKVLAERAPEPQAESLAAVAAELEEITQSTLQDLRSLVNQLQPSPVADKGLRAALQTLVENTRRRTGIDVALAVADAVDEVHAPLLEDVYFIVAEAVHNAVKHSGAGSIRVEIGGGGASALEVSVRDDGHGRLPELPDAAPGRSRGHGLASMRERAGQWGGQLSVDLGRGGGTTVRARFPLPQNRLDKEER
ncbi:hypothetical protein NCCP1664_17380 [Zafaria cholistanensis]|uniref:Histidine kinase domain-containing protein n=1 Tax=Zafaria cholistanensis TaxID=1682741 RepID=A0A5A7NSU3_9MICC|nr:GAF domain-containing sensor histidine kinase [Zafaria cholistanensis]GER23242.1 hypothetical protein NCCP1664_17380 [Zafaria cholistanensis]